MALAVRGGVHYDDHLPKDLSVCELPYAERLIFAVPNGYTVAVCSGDTVLRDAVLAYHSDTSVVVSTVCGTVGKVSEYAVEILPTDTTEQESPLFDNFAVPNADAIVDAVRRYGIFTQSGIPLWKVLDKMKGGGELLILNAAENEPGVYSARALMDLMPEKIAGGLKIFMKALALGKAVIATTDAMQGYAERIRAHFRKKDMTQIVTVMDKYPVSNPRVLYRTLTGSEREPSLRGAVIVSVMDCVSVYDLFDRGHTPIKRVVTVADKNYSVAIGTPLSQLADFCGVVIPHGTVCHVGGLVSAREAKADEAVTASTAAIQYLSHSAVITDHCIECGKCAGCCPMGLRPMRAMTAPQRIREQMAQACIGCGVCATVCPVGIAPNRIMGRKEGSYEN